jgi:hypothetical protein
VRVVAIDVPLPQGDAEVTSPPHPFASSPSGGCMVAITSECAGRVMSEEDLEKYETDVELKIYKEYRDVLPMFKYVIETERRFYLANEVNLQARRADGTLYFELELGDAWVWDMYRPARFVKSVKVMTFRDVNIEELERPI